MNEEGVIKFKAEWIQHPPLHHNLMDELNITRQRLYKLGLIGCNEDGIGYGNISTRFKKNSFIISGSGTGCVENTNINHYTLVKEFDFKTNSLLCEGPVIASSESLTHAMVYQCLANINSVIHIHHKELWKKLMHLLPHTSKKVEYGTPEMAMEIQALLKETEICNHHIFAMGGHEDGVIAFGNIAAAAEKTILSYM